jgi:hypothetical protein
MPPPLADVLLDEVLPHPVGGEHQHGIGLVVAVVGLGRCGRGCAVSGHGRCCRRGHAAHHQQQTGAENDAGETISAMLDRQHKNLLSILSVNSGLTGCLCRMAPGSYLAPLSATNDQQGVSHEPVSWKDL